MRKIQRNVKFEAIFVKKSIHGRFFKRLGSSAIEKGDNNQEFLRKFHFKRRIPRLKVSKHLFLHKKRLKTYPAINVKPQKFSEFLIESIFLIKY